MLRLLGRGLMRAAPQRLHVAPMAFQTRYFSSNAKPDDNTSGSSDTKGDKNEEKSENGSKGEEEVLTFKKTKKTYYEILGVTMTASKEEVKAAYIKKAKESHPDQNPDDPLAQSRFQEIQEAYSVIGNSWKRGLYDTDLRFAKDSPGGAAAHPGASFDGMTEDEWKKQFGAETEEQRLMRRERYKRYAAGTREDIPEEPMRKITPLVVAFTVFAFWFAGSEAPKHWGPQSVEDHNDYERTDDMRGVRGLRAFHNPIMDKWERLPDGYKAPTPFALYKFYESNPDLLLPPGVKINAANPVASRAAIEQRRKKLDPGLLPVNALTTLNSVPENQTVWPVLLVDEKTNELVVFDKTSKTAKKYTPGTTVITVEIPVVGE